MKVRPSALIIESNRVLTMHYQYQGVDVFGLPGGNPDPGETLEKALIRELEEELGVSVLVKNLLVAGEVIWPEVSRETLHMVFSVEIVGGVPKLNPEHTTALAIEWIPVSSLPDHLCYPNFGHELLACYNSGKGAGYVGPANQPYLAG
ncbi:NUDIX domain-containing protein [Dyadobacter tibetensis]|uniref:NUDIX domain-containing protein n=1 Tax=Dyadobacter tibetensis TaxID=1211851 RepID=UPI0004726036|nr:NUDIX domain-containing protein [Dyadobacter tibetensis]